MIISPPFLPAAGTTSNDANALDPVMDAVDQFEMAHGIYPIAFDRRWHTGIHLMPPTQNERVRAIADGEVVAYRVCQKAIDGGSGTPDSNPGFVLLKHTTETGDGRSITFYSLYMHLLELDGYADLGVQINSLPEYLRTPTPDDGQSGGGRKVYRKDVLGLPGRCHGQMHIHFEVFMLPADFTAYFDNTQLDNKQPATPAHQDCWGHSYYIIPSGQTFLAKPTGTDTHNKLHSIPFAPLQGGTNQGYALHAETYFHKGDKYTSTWRVEQDGTRTLLTPQPVKEAGYEYGMTTRATKLYPAWPSDGLELMRFGRILTNSPTLPDMSANTPSGIAPGVDGNPHPMNQANPRSTWIRVTYAPGQEGYLDVNGGGIAVLSDADFPFLAGWQKISEGNTPYGDDGMCDVDALKKILGDVAQPSAGANESDDEDALSDYVKGNNAVRAQLRGFICEAPTEWNSAHNDTRYAKLNDADGFYGRSPGMAHIADSRSISFHVAPCNSIVRTEVSNSSRIANRVSGVPATEIAANKCWSSSASSARLWRVGGSVTTSDVLSAATGFASSRPLIIARLNIASRCWRRRIAIWGAPSPLRSSPARVLRFAIDCSRS